jgi:porin
MIKRNHCTGMLCTLMVALLDISNSTLAKAANATAARIWDVGLTYKIDVMAPVAGGLRNKPYGLDNVDLVGTADLDRLAGWTGASAHIHLLNNNGGSPNDAAGTLQGIDNIEVSSQRLRLFEAWLNQQFGDNVGLRLGLYDLNSEFYSAPSAGLLLAPPFGIGSEIAATGPNGPSIFPSTALAVRLRVEAHGYYTHFAVVNAAAGTVGDAGGVDVSFNSGALVIGEVGHEGDVKISLGAWAYTRRQDDVRQLDPNGEPLRRRAFGGYLLADIPILNSGSSGYVSLFGRAGWSDGRTTPYSGGWQLGISVRELIVGHPDSALSLGIHEGRLSSAYRANERDAGGSPAKSERAIELTVSDRVASRLTLQPDIQWIFDPGGDRRRRSLVVMGLRTTLSL